MATLDSIEKRAFDWVEERAAILEFDAGMDRRAAETEARLQWQTAAVGKKAASKKNSQ